MGMVFGRFGPVVLSWRSSVEVKGDQSSSVALSGSSCLKQLGTVEADSRV